MGVQSVTMFNYFPKVAFQHEFKFNEGNIWIAMMNTKKGTPSASDEDFRYQFSGNKSSTYNPHILDGARLRMEGDELVFSATNHSFRGNEDAFYLNPEVTHIGISWIRDGGNSGVGMCFFPVSWPNFDNDSVKKTITWDNRGIFRCKLVRP